MLAQSSAAVAAQEAARLLEMKRRHDELWKQVGKDASDFTGWTSLIDVVLKMVGWVCCVCDVVCCKQHVVACIPILRIHVLIIITDSGSTLP